MSDLGIIMGTGHRPDHLGGYDDNTFQNLINLAGAWLRHNKPRVVISGMALGWDQALAVASTSLKIETWAYIPCRFHGNNWPVSAYRRYQLILRKCERVVYTHDGPYNGPQCMFKRDRRMVEDCDGVLALYNDNILDGGTARTVRYAQQRRKWFFNLWDNYQRQYGESKVELPPRD